MLTIQELRSSTLKELLQELEKARKEMLKVRVNVKTKHAKDTAKVEKSKRYIAQVLTVLKEVGKEEVSGSAQDKKPQEEKVEKSEKADPESPESPETSSGEKSKKADPESIPDQSPAQGSGETAKK